jgi:hypothetical protein
MSMSQDLPRIIHLLFGMSMVAQALLVLLPNWQ